MPEQKNIAEHIRNPYDTSILLSMEAAKISLFKQYHKFTRHLNSNSEKVDFLLKHLQKPEVNQFYESLSAKNHETWFNILLFNTLRLEFAMGAVNEKLEITQSKLNKIVKMLDKNTRNYVQKIKKEEPSQVFEELKLRLQEQKNYLVNTSEKLDLEKQKEIEIEAERLKLVQESKRQTRLQKEQQAKERKIEIAKERQEQARQAPMRQVLLTVHFDDYIKKFESKANKYRNKTEAKYKNAVSVAEKLVADLQNAKKEFLGSNQSIEANKILFKTNCLKAIDLSREVLELPRGWRQLVAKFFSVLISVLSLGIANCVTGKNMFSLFSSKTGSQKYLDNFSSELNKGINCSLSSQ